MLLKKKICHLHVIKTELIKSLQMPRSSLLNVHYKINKNIISYIPTHNPKNREVFHFGITKQNLDILYSDSDLKKISK